MAAANTDKFKKAKRKFSTTTSGVFSAGATTLPLTSTSGLDTDTAITLVIDAGTASEEVITGVVSGSNVVNCLRGKEGTSDVSHADGAAVTMYFTETHWDDLITGILVSHNQDGTLANNSVTAASITDGVVTNAKLNSDLQQGWINLNDAPDTITYNGNRSYSLVFNSVDLSSTLSVGQRMKLTRTVVAPTQCTDLESSSSQYYSKTSPAGLTFTTTFTCMAWIKLESYGSDMGIIARRNGDTEGFSFGIDATGRVVLTGLRIAGNNKQIVSYNSVPLGRWVHVAAAIDMTAGDTAAQLIWIDGVSVNRAYTLTGTASALVQGTTALVVGALKSAGTNPFDGKIAQAAIFSSALTSATVRSYASQGLSGSESTLVSAYSFDNSINDLNTTNANNLTANGSAVATDTDSPFANAVSTGLQEYGIITKVAFSTNTTVNVQVPEGCAIPTSGGISNVYYSAARAPYGMPASVDKWMLTTSNKQTASASLASATWSNLGILNFTIPIGSWNLAYKTSIYVSTATGGISMNTTLSTANNTESDGKFTIRTENPGGTQAITSPHTLYPEPVTVSSATIYYFNSSHSAGSTQTLYNFGDRNGGTVINAYFGLL